MAGRGLVGLGIPNEASVRNGVRRRIWTTTRGREQFCLDVLLQEAATGGTMHSAAHPEVALVDARTAKQLTYPP